MTDRETRAFGVVKTFTSSPPVPAQRSALDDERSLIDRAVAGDRAAFGELFALHQPGLLRFIRSRVGSAHAIAEDLTQTVFLRALRAVDTYRPTGAFAAWLTTIAKNVIADHYKGGFYHYENVGGEAYEASVAAMVERHGEPVTRVLDADLADAVRRAVSVLTDEQVAVIEARFFDGLSVQETSDRLGINVGAVKAAQYRATQMMRKNNADLKGYV